MIELSITVKDESQTLTQKHLIYDPIILSRGSPEIQPYVNEIMEAFKGDKGDVDVVIRAKMIW